MSSNQTCSLFIRSVFLPESLRRQVNRHHATLAVYMYAYVHTNTCTYTFHYQIQRRRPLSAAKWQSIHVRPLPSATGKTREMQNLLRMQHLLTLHRLNFLCSPSNTVGSSKYYLCIFSPLLSTPLY